jgi:hypothetical protein
MPRTAILLALLAGCGGAGAAGSPCNERADCVAGLECSGPDDGPGCGIAPREECTTDTDCQGGRCDAIEDGCSADDVGSQCNPACTGDAECGPGFACPAGACVAILCDAGFTCAAREVCDPARIPTTAPVYDRHHGCFAVACSTDGECNGLTCVNGTCQDGPGTCAKPMLVP